MPKRNTLKIIFVIAVILIAMIFTLREIIVYNQQRAEFENKTYDTLEDFDTVREVCFYLDCEYIREEISSSKNYDLDIYLKFKYDLYSDGASNEEYFYRAAILFEQVVGYQNIRLIDEEKEIVMAMVGDTSKKKILKLYINGNDNYYGEKDTIEALENYKATNISRMEIQSKVLKDLLANEWKAQNVDFGSQESTFDGYDIYFDEGIEVRKIGTKIFNIVFTEKYTEQIVNGITVNTESSKIVDILGNPAFGEVNSKILGYKGEKIYIFFEENRVSVYPVETNSKEQELLTTIETFRQTRDLKAFINTITDMWPDYDEYEYDEDKVNLVYTTKGVKFEFNTQRDNGIIFYNNYSGTYISDLRQSKNNLPLYTYFVDTNSVYEKEQENKIKHDYSYLRDNYEYVKDQTLRYSLGDMEKYEFDSKKYFVKYEEGEYNLKIISLDNSVPPLEIEDKVNSYFWISDNLVAYGIKNRGIYLINVDTKEKSIIIEGQDDFYIKNYNNGFLYYDDKYLIYGLANEGMDSYIWINDSIIIYSKKNQGIYLYNIATQERSTIIDGQEEFNLVKYENGRLYYDNTNIFYIIY